MTKSDTNEFLNQDPPSMSLVPCRACGYTVDTSALACPKCGATDPGHKISRQSRQAITFTLQFLIGISLLVGGGWYAWHEFGPVIKAALVKQNQG
jgi:hypothetical protein